MQLICIYKNCHGLTWEQGSAFYIFLGLVKASLVLQVRFVTRRIMLVNVSVFTSHHGRSHTIATFGVFIKNT